MAAGVLLLIFLLPAASAQLPEPLMPVAGSAMAFVVLCADTLLEPSYAGDDEVTCFVQDLSRDSVFVPGQAGGTSPSQHTVMLRVEPKNESIDAKGWQVLITRPFIPIVGGETVEFGVNVKATPLIDAQDYAFDLVATFSGPGGYNSTSRIPFSAEVGRYDFALLSWSGSQSQRAGQDDVVIYSVLVQNTGVYPDSYRFTINAPPDIRVSTPSNVYVPAGESRVVNISVLTPHSKIYEVGRSEAISIKVASVSGSGVYSTTALLQIRGSYIPVYWIPLLVVGAVSAGIVARGTAESRELRRLERGRPRPVALTPRQQVLLAEMRRSDPEAYKTKRRSLDVVYKERLSDYRATRRERAARDREESRQAKQELAERKKQMRAQRAEEKRLQRIADKEAKAAAVVAKKEAKQEAKLLAKKEKVLEKARKKLEKAKADKKQAKLDAKAAKAAEKEAKKAAKAAKKQAK